jgi:hypothetical protein
MIPKYPEGLPLPLRDGYGLDKVNRIRSTEMDVGRGVQRWEFDDAPEMPTVSWIFTDVESRLFNAWVNQIVKAGWFTIRLLTDMGFDDVTARFKSSPARAELVARYSWRWTATLEIEFEQMLPPDWVIILPDYILHADIFDKAQNWEKPEVLPAPTTQRTVSGGEARVVNGLEERVV